MKLRIYFILLLALLGLAVQTNGQERGRPGVSAAEVAAIGQTNIQLQGLFESYANREALPNAGRAQMLKLQNLLNTLGISSNLVDGCYFREGLNSQTVAPITFKGVSPATNVAGWSWVPGGILISNTAAGQLVYPVQDCTNETTLIVWTAGLANTASALGFVATLVHTNGTGSGQFHMFCPDASGNIILQHYAGGAVTTTTSIRSVGDLSFRGMSSAWSLGGKIENMADERYAESAGNSALHTALNHLWIGGSAARFTMAGWMLFDKKLTTNQIKAINYSLPRTRMIVEGDSISLYYYTNSASRFNVTGWAQWTNQSTGGHTTIDMLGETNQWKTLGPDGTNVTDAYISIMGGANDIANLSSPAPTILTNLRILWATARANNIKPIAWTVTGGSGIRTAGLDTNRTQLNQLIRADGSNYHQLIDVDAYLYATLGPQYYSNSVFSTDNIHPNFGGAGMIGPLLGDSFAPMAKIPKAKDQDYLDPAFAAVAAASITLTNFAAVTTNYFPTLWVPVAGQIRFFGSNNAIYAVSVTKTNLISAP
jgi:lysophospholipase L1-like esterase